jgi:hypothetical protein
MGRGGDNRCAIIHRHPRHLNGILKRRRAIILAMQDVGMNVNHKIPNTGCR